MDGQAIEALRRTRYLTLAEDEDLEKVYRLRHRCYLAEGSIEDTDQALMTDAFDRSKNCVHVAVEMDGEIRSAVRLHIVTMQSPTSPTLEVFPELKEHLERGETILDPTRFVVDPKARAQRVPLNFLTLRIAVLATIFYDVDIALAPVRPEHGAFYRRYLGHEPAFGARQFPGLKKPIELLIAKREQRDAVLERTPVFGPLKDFPNSNVDFPELPGVSVASKRGRWDAA
jgi:hypothetical protein